MTKKYSGHERRKFIRLDYVSPLNYKVCKKETVSRLLQGYTSDISEGGLRCNINGNIDKDKILWLSFDRSVLDVCRDIESKCLVYQNGVLGKVVWSQKKANNTCDVGIRFLTRQEKNLTHIYPKSYFFAQNEKKAK